MQKPAEETDGRRSLRTYLHDHLAGAEHAMQLLQALEEHHQGTSLGDFAAHQLKQVEADFKVLEELSRTVGGEQFEWKEAAGWLVDKLSRMKLAHPSSPFSTFETLEFLGLGILGKRGLWRVLMAVAPSLLAIQGIDFATLIERAEAQYAATEKLRLSIGTEIFA